MNSTFISVPTAYGLIVAFVDIDMIDGVPFAVDIDIQKFTPSDKMRHKIINEFQRANRKPRRGRLGVAWRGEQLESEVLSNGTEE